MNKHFKDLYEKTTAWWLLHSLYDPAWIFQLEATFEESYCIRGGLQRLRYLGRTAPSPGKPNRAGGSPDADKPSAGPLKDAMVRNDVETKGCDTEESQRLEAGTFAYCDRVMSHQGVQGPPEALYMGYGVRVVHGVVDCCCVADQASVANGVLDTIAMYKDHPRAARWLASIERWADWVIREFATQTGGIGVGVLGHKWNPIPEYWCATSLFATSLFKLAVLTGKEDYLKRAMAALDWLARFDHTAVEIPKFTECAPEVILYAGEGLVEGLRFVASTLGPQAAKDHPAADKLRSMARWLIANQLAEGRWPDPPARGYREYSLGIPWILFQMNRLIGPDKERTACAERCLSHLLRPEGERYYGLYVRPWGMGLVWLSLGEMAGDSCGTPMAKRSNNRTSRTP